MFHEMGQIERIEHGRGGVNINGRIPGRFLARFTPWLTAAQNNELPNHTAIPSAEEEQG
jgi:hypothetical protein